MKPRTSALALALALMACGGCHSILSPTVADRHASFRTRQGAFSGDSVRADIQTFLVITLGPGAGTLSVDPATGVIRLSGAPGGTYGQGLAVAVDRAGYLLTARHILGAHNYVIGWMDGHLGVFPARIVSSGPSDLAVIAVQAHPDFAARVGLAPPVGTPVFAVACNHTQATIGGELTLVGGILLAPAVGRDLITSDVPLWYGDSGGPLLAPNGDLIGINSAIRFSWSYGGSYVRLSCPVDGALVGRLIAADLARMTRVPGLQR